MNAQRPQPPPRPAADDAAVRVERATAERGARILRLARERIRKGETPYLAVLRARQQIEREEAESE